MNEPEGFENQVINAAIADQIIGFLTDTTKGPREAMGVLVVAIKKLNAEPHREEPIPSNKELADEILTTLNSYKRIELQ